MSLINCLRASTTHLGGCKEIESSNCLLRMLSRSHSRLPLTSSYFQVFSFWSGGQPGEFSLTAGGFALYVPVTGGNWAANCYFCAPGTVWTLAAMPQART